MSINQTITLNVLGNAGGYMQASNIGRAVAGFQSSLDVSDGSIRQSLGALVRKNLINTQIVDGITLYGINEEGVERLRLLKAILGKLEIDDRLVA